MEEDYSVWDLAINKEFSKCCLNDSIIELIDEYLLKSLPNKKILFEIIVSEFYEVSDSVLIKEYYSESNESTTHSMFVFINGKGKRASLNFRGKISLHKETYNQINNFTMDENCCPFSFEEYKTEIRIAPVTCNTLILLEKGKPRFEVSLRFN